MRDDAPMASVASESLVDAGARRDIMGVVLAVFAVASLIAVVATDSAPVAAAVGGFYHLGFGFGAYVLPLALLFVAASLFVKAGAPVRVRTLVGSCLIFVAVISLLSLFGLPEDRIFGVTVDEGDLAATGGYLGMWVSGALSSALGLPISIVVLVGIAVAGLVVIGFSISELARGASERMAAFRGAHAKPDANMTPWGDEMPAPGNLPVQGAQQRIPFEGAPGDVAPETTFLGNRTTTVLDGAVDFGEDPFVDLSSQLEAESAKTTLLDADESASDAKAVEAPSPRMIPIEEKFVEEGEKSLDRRSPERPEATSPEASAGPSAVIVPSFLQAAAVAAKDGGAVAPASSDIVENGKATAKDSPRPSGGTAGRASSGEGDESPILPPVSLLRHNPSKGVSEAREEELEQTAEGLQATLAEFNLHARVVGWITGPTVTTFKVQPGEGERVSRISSLEDDIALSLATTAVRIFAPIPDTSLVGIEIPNRTRQNVFLGDVLPYAQGGPLELAIGRDSEGLPIVADLAKMPHLLIAGTTGSGKSVMINTIITSMLMRATPEEVRLIMVDPKRVELAGYNGLPHLYVPVVTEPKQAASALQWGVAEMERRLKIFERLHVRNIGTFNEKQKAGEFEKYDNPPSRMPYLVIIIDELSDLMMVAGKDVEASIVRIAQLGRAAGIHLIVATQRPSANVVTGLIKANIINRIAFNVGSGIDSRVIIDQTGAEKLIGLGDMLFSKVGWSKPKRIQGCFVSDEEIAAVVDFLKENGEADYHEEILSAVSPAHQGQGGAREASEDDPLLWDAARIVVESGLGSTSGLQRRLKVGYARAGRIMDMLEEHGVVGPPDGSKPREVMLDAEALEALIETEQQGQADYESEVF